MGLVSRNHFCLVGRARSIPVKSGPASTVASASNDPLLSHSKNWVRSLECISGVDQLGYSVFCVRALPLFRGNSSMVEVMCMSSPSRLKLGPQEQSPIRS